MAAACTDEQKELLKQFKVLHFQPFDPVGKKTAAKIQSPEGEIFHTSKGIVLYLPCHIIITTSSITTTTTTISYIFSLLLPYGNRCPSSDSQTGREWTQDQTERASSTASPLPF